MNEKELESVKILQKDYLGKSEDEKTIESLFKLDAKVKLPAYIFAYTFGILSTLLLGFGMSIAMKQILEQYFILGIVLGIIGIIFISINYPIYSLILKSRKNKYKDEIINVTNNLINKNND